MKHDSLKRMHRQQRGLTLIELMIAIALTGIVTAAITMVVSDVFSASARTSNQMIALRNVEAANYWLSRDVRQADPGRINLSPSGAQLVVLEWPLFDEEDEVWRTTIVDYILDHTTGDLRRLEYLKPDSSSDPELVAHTIVAQHIDSGTTLRWDDDTRVLVFEVTATVRGQSVIRMYEIMPRLA